MRSLACTRKWLKDLRETLRENEEKREKEKLEKRQNGDKEKEKDKDRGGERDQDRGKDKDKSKEERQLPKRDVCCEVGVLLTTLSSRPPLFTQSLA